MRILLSVLFVKISRKAEPSYLFDAAVRGGFFTVVHHLLKDKNKPNAVFVIKAFHNGVIKAFKENIDPRPCAVTVMISA